MDESCFSDIQNTYGIDLSNYFIDKNSYNPIVFIHKKYLPAEDKNETNFVKKSKDKNKSDKCQQFDYDRLHCETDKTRIFDSDHVDPLVEQTIKFAKDIIPITIPPNTDISNPVYYTITPSKKIKRKHEPKSKISQKNNYEQDKDATFVKAECYRTDNAKQGKYKRTNDNISARSDSHYSPNNTIDDINENQSLSYSLSESSEQKHLKKDYINQPNQKTKSQRIVASESFEAIATEYMNASSDSTIKIHLMNERDKLTFCENICSPLLKTVKEYFNDLNHKTDKTDVNIELQDIKKTMQYQANKLDIILDKLICVENKLEIISKAQLSPKVEIIKASKLQEIGRDIVDIKDLSSEEELGCINLLKNNSSVPTYSGNDAERGVESIDNLARGENIPVHFRPSNLQLGIKPERSNRLPARFCWTDTAVKS